MMSKQKHPKIAKMTNLKSLPLKGEYYYSVKWETIRMIEIWLIMNPISMYTMKYGFMCLSRE